MERREPILNAPAVVTSSLVILVGVHVALNLLDERLSWELFKALAFVPARYSELARDMTGYPWANYTSPVTHMFVHGDWVHLLVNCAWFLAVGTVVARRVGGARFLLVAAICGMAGAGAFFLTNPYAAIVLVGASGAISGLMAIAFRLIFSARVPEVQVLLSREPRRVPRVGLVGLLNDRRAIGIVGLWVGINLLFAFGWSDVLVSGKIAWEAHLGGFFCGFFIFGLIDPGPREGGRTRSVHADM